MASGFQPYQSLLAKSQLSGWSQNDEWSQQSVDSVDVVPSTQETGLQKLSVRRPTAKRTFANVSVPSGLDSVQRPPMCKKSKAVDVGEADADANKTKGKRWKEHWIVTLIHIRGQMQSEFMKPPKQGVDLWHKLFVRLCSTCADFDKDAQACRKKWKTIYADFKEDKTSNGISGNARSSKCKWFTIVDEYMHDRPHVVCYAHASAHELDGEGGNEDQLTPEITPMKSKDEIMTSKEGSIASKKNRQSNDVIATALADLKSSGSKLFDLIREKESEKIEKEKEKVDIMKAMHGLIATLVHKF